MGRYFNIIAVVFLIGVTFQAKAQKLEFASVSEAQLILSTNDAFLARLSPFDRAARMKTDRTISEVQFVEFVAASAMNWQKQEKSTVKKAFTNIQKAITRFALPLPDKIYFIKTSGREEGNATYTRLNAIIIPKVSLAKPSNEMQRLLAHELFHISSRLNATLAQSLYKTIGFQYCGELAFPEMLASQKITNPDAPKNDYCIKLKLGTESILAIPILFSRVPKYDMSKGGEFFQYLQLKLLLVEQLTGSNTPRVLYDSGKPRLVAIKQVSGFLEQVGQNTKYIIHPEEILADNFALLVLGKKNVPSPDVLVRMQRVLENASKEE